MIKVGNRDGCRDRENRLVQGNHGNVFTDGAPDGGRRFLFIKHKQTNAIDLGLCCRDNSLVLFNGEVRISQIGRENP